MLSSWTRFVVIFVLMWIFSLALLNINQFLSFLFCCSPTWSPPNCFYCFPLYFWLTPCFNELKFSCFCAWILTLLWSWHWDVTHTFAKNPAERLKGSISPFLVRMKKTRWHPNLPLVLSRLHFWSFCISFIIELTSTFCLLRLLLFLIITLNLGRLIIEICYHPRTCHMFYSFWKSR